MLHYFPDPYKNEILYSVLARFQYYSANPSIEQTLRDLFDDPTVSSSLFIPTKLNTLVQKLPPNKEYSLENLVFNHTLYPLRYPFFDETSKEKFWVDLSSQKRLDSNNSVQGQELMYCPVCAKMDYENHGEAFFRREHHIKGLTFCLDHYCELLQYPISRNVISGRSYIRFDYDLIHQDPNNLILDFRFGKKLLNIGHSIKYLLNNQISQNDWNKKIRYHLWSIGLATINGPIKQFELCVAFKEFYTEEILDYLGLNFNVHNPESWIRKVINKVNGSKEPIKNILIINFLFNNIVEFIMSEIKPFEPFGPGPYPCFNLISDHYKEEVIPNVMYRKEKGPIGIFTCSCGFSYSVKVSDGSNLRDLQKIHVLQYGNVWEDRLRQLILTGSYSITELGRLMKCDTRTVLRQATKLGLRGLINSKIGFKYCKRISYDELKVKYRSKILEVIQENSNLRRQQIYDLVTPESQWLRKHDKEWLFKNLPPAINPLSDKKKKTNKLYWKELDEKVHMEILGLYSTLKLDTNRLTKGLFLRRIGKSGLITNLDKLTLTGELLNNVIETIEEFWCRRVDIHCIEIKEMLGRIEIRQVRNKCNYNRRPELQSLINERIKYNLEKDQMTS